MKQILNFLLCTGFEVLTFFQSTHMNRNMFKLALSRNLRDGLSDIKVTNHI
jgi:hypothetical protein